MYWALHYGLAFGLPKNKTQLKTIFSQKEIFPAWALGLSLLSTLISSVTFLGYPAQGLYQQLDIIGAGIDGAYCFVRCYLVYRSALQKSDRSQHLRIF